MAIGLFTVSCSNKKVIISGNIAGANPMSRIEIINTSDPATLPIYNFATDAKGNFNDTIPLPKNGVYAITFEGSNGLVYLKRGDHLVIKGQAGVFPKMFTVGKENKNNLFLQKSQTVIENYFYGVGQDILVQSENVFLTRLKKIRADLGKQIENIAKTTKADSDVLDWKKGDLDTQLLMIAGQYAAQHGQITGNAAFKVSKKFADYEKELAGNELETIKTYPTYRRFLINGMAQKFQEYATKHMKSGTTYTEAFIKYLNTQKHSDQVINDYLLAYVATSVDMQPNLQNPDKLRKLLHDNIQTSNVREDMDKVVTAVFGPELKTPAPSVDFYNAEGKKVSSSKVYDSGKNNLVIFYASWTPYFKQSISPALKVLTDKYKGKINFVFVNLDDNFAEFKKANKDLLAGIPGEKLYFKKGINSDAARAYGMYGFRLPSAVLISKKGMIESQTFMNLSDFRLSLELERAAGVTTPAAPKLPVPGK